MRSAPHPMGVEQRESELALSGLEEVGPVGRADKNYVPVLDLRIVGKDEVPTTGPREPAAHLGTHLRHAGEAGVVSRVHEEPHGHVHGRYVARDEQRPGTAGNAHVLGDDGVRGSRDHLSTAHVGEVVAGVDDRPHALPPRSPVGGSPPLRLARCLVVLAEGLGPLHDGFGRAPRVVHAPGLVAHIDLTTVSLTSNS